VYYVQPNLGISITSWQSAAVGLALLLAGGLAVFFCCADRKRLAYHPVVDSEVEVAAVTSTAAFQVSSNCNSVIISLANLI
jgi:hypothetical protein